MNANDNANTVLYMDITYIGMNKILPQAMKFWNIWPQKMKATEK